ncbi:hypothetical protein B0A48_17939 [Cryoendolithus antarcticus]|uniref:Uncharacterized protein n=1 Tax=Cryoendolithus antarcticus TaxID=1507870 RepID=A0A1V8S9N5_9PEZI|nr:hypothetical protein B0A48_17939 [Cryoendolithus antarcticus]
MSAGQVTQVKDRGTRITVRCHITVATRMMIEDQESPGVLITLNPHNTLTTHMPMTDETETMTARDDTATRVPARTKRSQRGGGASRRRRQRSRGQPYGLVLYSFWFVQESYAAGKITELDRTISGLVCGMLRRAKRTLTSVSNLPAKTEDRRESTLPLTRENLRKILGQFSDQQLVTGLAVLTVGYIQTKTITQYHFSIVASLADLAFVVQSCSTDIVLQSLADQPVKRLWRGVAVLLFMFLALMTSVPAGNYFWLYNFGMPVQCIWQSFRGNYRPGWRLAVMVIGMIMQIWAILIVAHDWFPSIYQNAVGRTVKRGILWTVLLPRRTAYRAANNREASNMTSSKCLWACLEVCSGSVALFVFVATEIVFSEAFDLLRSWAILVNSVYTVSWLRGLASENGRTGNEDTWGFGQAVAVMLLALPVFTIVETLAEERSNRKDSTRGSGAPVTDQSGLLANAALTVEPQHQHDSPPAIDHSAPAGSSSSVMRFLRGPRRIDTEGGRSVARTTSIDIQVQSADYNGFQTTRANSRGAYELQPLPSTLPASLTPLAQPTQVAAPASAQVTPAY